MVLRIVGDDAGDERLERLVPAVLLGVQGAVALDDPAIVARSWGAQGERRRARRAVEDLAHGLQRGAQARAVVLGQAVEQRPDLGRGAGVERRVGRAAGGGERDDLPPRVVAGALAGKEALLFQAAEEPAEVAGVDLEGAPQVPGVGRLALAELVEDARLGERVGGARSPSRSAPMRAV